ncbi:MAG: hypothetical protein AB1744_11935, partial [Candidatus Zixiibacteriota bacterium]
NGRRKLFLDVQASEKPGQYKLDTVLYFHRPFGMLVDCFDRMRPDGMQQAVYRLSLYIDDNLYYEVVFDSIDFETTSSVELEYDHVEAANDRKHVRTLFKKAGNVYSGSRAVNGNRGIFGLAGNERFGLHQARVTAEDCFGNRSELSFRFLWGPPGSIYVLDSTTTRPPDSTFFYFSPTVRQKTLGVDSVVAMLNRGDMWGLPTTARLKRLADDRLVCEVEAHRIRTAVLRLFVVAQGSCVIPDILFNGLVEKGKGHIEIEHEVLEDGLLISIPTRNKYASDVRVELYCNGELLGIEPAVCYHMRQYYCFIPPLEKYSCIDRIAVAMSHDTTVKPTKDDSVNIFAVGFRDSEHVAAGRFLTLNMGKETFYEPRYVEVTEKTLFNRSRLHLNSPYYEILPEAFVCRKPYRLVLKLPYKNLLNDHSGLCWLDKKEDRWIWLEDNEYRNDTLTAASLGGGIFAALLDSEPPRLKYLTIADGRTYQNHRPAVNFVIDDTIAGIGDDQGIVIEIDGEWQIPEYDPETGQVLSKPVEPLTSGRHHLGIRVTDRAGNLAEQYLNFSVK